jgi:hypothetical protein
MQKVEHVSTPNYFVYSYGVTDAEVVGTEVPDNRREDNPPHFSKF